ncbi:MAG: gdhB 3 [Pedosphaera sp.]|nr:gdhB 3 [Pedosphaera sp.]
MRKACYKTRLHSFLGCSLTLLTLLDCSAVRAIADEAFPALELKPAFPELKVKQPLWLEEAPDNSKRLFVIEKDGRILILPHDRNGKEAKVFLDIVDRKPNQNYEEGLLGMAFHPDFKKNHKFYVYYSQLDPKRSVLSEFTVSATDPDKADLASERIVIEVPMVYGNHNGGTLIFGPDGYLYISIGDGGKGKDPHEFGQSTRFLWGKILRIDVNSRSGHLQYGVPKDNPFVGKSVEGHRAEIWAYGLRNPWRMSFDRETGELWAADVGQDKWEEIDLIVKGGNYGWSFREGFHSYKDAPADAKWIDPILEYAHTPALQKECKFPEHSVGTSITGGYVYRGKKLPALCGTYVYADFAQGTVWGLRYEKGAVTANATLVKANPVRPITSFGQDQDGEIYLLSFDGKIYEFAAKTSEPVKK